MTEQNTELNASERREVSECSDLLSNREVELINEMIEVQLNHAERCDHIANRKMAEKQKGWDMERVKLLRKVLSVMGGG